MAPRSRSEQLALVGLEGLPADPGPADLVRAVARMLAAATEKKKAKSPEAPKLAIGPREFFETVRELAGERLLCDPVDARWFGRLAGTLKALPDLAASDAEAVGSWLAAGGCRTWPTGVPTFGHAITHLDKWIAWAREWDRRGRPEMSGKTNVGNSVAAADFSAFKAPKLL